MKTLHLLITGRVQGVGFRDWLVHEATRSGLAGWVRNMGLDTVEAVISGPAEAVDRCVRLCWQGPALTAVSSVSATETTPPGEPGFMRRGSVAAHR